MDRDERPEAIRRIDELKGQNLRALAGEHGVTVFKGGKLNKGWVGHTMERCLGLPLNSSRNPNAGSWELKVASLVYRKSGKLVPKETMLITSLTAEDVTARSFEHSHLLGKLRHLLVVSRVFESRKKPTHLSTERPPSTSTMLIRTSWSKPTTTWFEDHQNNRVRFADGQNGGVDPATD